MMDKVVIIMQNVYGDFDIAIPKPIGFKLDKAQARAEVERLSKENPNETYSIKTVKLI